LNRLGLLAAFSFLVAGAYVSAQPGPTLGYDRVPWGSSIADVRRAYSIDSAIAATPFPSDPNITEIEQNNVSDSIDNRIFMFIENKLFQVRVEYRDPSANAAQSLLSALSSRFGERTEHKVEYSSYDSDRREDITIFGRHFPELVVEVFHTYISNKETYLEVCYTWIEFYSEYYASKVNL